MPHKRLTESGVAPRGAILTSSPVDRAPRAWRQRDTVVPAVVGVLLVAAAAALILSSLKRPELPTYAPTALDIRDVGAVLDTGMVTVDVSAEEAWTFFDFSRGAAVPAPPGTDWDLGFHRFNVIVNGGEAFRGRGGALDMGSVPFDAVAEVPAEGYVTTDAGRDSAHAVLGDWYDYSFTSHLLRPKDRTYALRTADGRYAKLRILSYYCPGAVPGCITFRYAYQGDGSRRVGP